MNKPPLGVMPKIIWIEKRICELTRAIDEYCQIGEYSTVKKWVKELDELLEKRELEICKEKVNFDYNNFYEVKEKINYCDDCNGTGIFKHRFSGGWVIDESCYKCGGAGKI